MMINICFQIYNKESIYGFITICNIFLGYPPVTTHVIMEMLAFQIASLCSTIPWVVLIVGVYLQLDVFYFIFEDLFGSSNERNNSITVILLILRILSHYGIFEVCRVLGYTGVFMIILISNCSNIMSIAESGILAAKTMCIYYNQFYLSTKILVPVVCKIASMILSLSFWMLVVAWWMLLKGFHGTPILLFGALLISTLLVTYLLQYVLYVLARCGNHLDDLVTKIHHQLRMEYVSFRGSNAEKRKIKEFWSCSKALKAFRYPYYPFLEVDYTFVRNMLDNLAQRVADACIIF